MIRIGPKFQRLTRLGSDRRGAVAIIFGLSAIPLVLFTGLAVDVSSAYVTRARLGQAVDAANLAIGSADGTYDDLKPIYDRFLEANFPSDRFGTPYNADIRIDDNVITAWASVDVDTAFLGLIGIDHLTVSFESEVTRETTGVELVMALDNTGSMGGSKISELKTSARDLIEILFGDEETPDGVKVGLVPFAGSVNIGTAQTAYVGDPDVHNWGPNSSWWGCVEARTSPQDTQDITVGIDDAAEAWTPFYWATHQSRNNWCETPWDTQCNQDWQFTSYSSIDHSPPSGRGPNKYCPREVTPLTNNKQLLLNRIDQMWAQGYTHINIGAAWAWRLISPKVPFDEGVAYNHPDWQKAVVIMTDGANTTSNSVYTAYGYRGDGRLGTTSGWRASRELDRRLTAVCDNIKDEGVLVYTIVYDLNNSNIENLMRDCATQPEMFFEAGEADLAAVFRTIGRQLSELRLSR